MSHSQGLRCSSLTDTFSSREPFLHGRILLLCPPRFPA